MNQRDKRLTKLLAGQPLSFDELHHLLIGLGFTCRIKGSHHIYARRTDQLVIPHHGQRVKDIYLKKTALLLQEQTPHESDE